jgi:hypothetical protein
MTAATVSWRRSSPDKRWRLLLATSAATVVESFIAAFPISK